MSEQRHLIKRQVLELKVSRADQTQRLYSEMSRIHHQQIAPLLDRCCTELSNPDRIHQIESLQLDLGYVDLHNFEGDLVAKLSKALPKALTEQIRSQEREGSHSGQGPKEMSQLELFALFARTGNLPWWSDLSQPQLLNDVLQSLIQNAPAPLSRLMRELARKARFLARIVRHYDDEILSALCCLLAPDFESSLVQFPPKLVALLKNGKALAGRTKAQIRNVIWWGILRTACLKKGRLRESAFFWKEVLLQIAVESGVTYASLLSGIRRSIQEVTTSMHGEFKDITETLFQELHGGAPGTEEFIQILARLQRSGGSLSALFEALQKVAGWLSPRIRAQLLAVLNPPARPVSRSETVKGIIQVLKLAIAHDALPSTGVRQWLADLEKLQPDGLPPEVLSELSKALQEALGEASHAEDRTEGLPELIQTLQDAIQDIVTTPSQVDETPVDFVFSDVDALYIENAGLVILWPFLGHFFEHLGLLEKKRFKDAMAVQRAVGLLQYLATEDPFPPEYVLPLNKVLCGMELTKVFDFGSSVTQAEMEECTNLLSAVIEHAPILKNMSIPGFRGSFLLRKGVLATRDDAWLLRVERESFDVVLDRFPWSINWVKLPWMEAPLRVEW